MFENHADQREMVLLFPFLFFYVVAMSKNNHNNNRQIAQKSQRRQQAASRSVLTAFAWLERRPWCIAWVLPSPKYWFKNLLNSNALNMQWKENLWVTRETFHFITQLLLLLSSNKILYFAQPY